MKYQAQTVLGDIPNEWESAKLKDCLESHQSGDWGDDFGEVELKVLRSTNFSNTRALKLEDVAVRGFSLAKGQKYDLKRGDILVERSGGGPTQPVGRIVVVTEDMNGFGFSNFVQLLRPHDEMDADYLAWCLFQLHQSGEIERLQHQTTQMRNLDFRDYLKAKLPKPPKTEQKRIGRALGGADAALLAARAELEAARHAKTALLQTLFSRGLPERHREFRSVEIFQRSLQIPQSWKLEPLGKSLVSVEYGTNASSNQGRHGYPIIGIPQMTDSVLKTQNWAYVEIPKGEAKQLRLESGDVLLIRTNGNPDYIAKSTLVTAEISDDHVVYASYLIRLRPQSDLLTGDYLNYFLASPEGRRQALACANTSAGNFNLGARSIKKFQLPRPNLEEQKTIVELIQSAEAVISSIETKVTALERVKTSLLQNLLTGRLRVAA